MNRFPTRAVAAAAAVLLAAGCSSSGGEGKSTPAKNDSAKPSQTAGPGLEIRLGKDLVAHQGVAVAALERETLQIRKQVTVPEPVAQGQLAGTGSRSRVFDSSFEYALLGESGMSASAPDGALKVADLAAAGSGKGVLTLTREQLTAAGVTGTVSGAQFTGSPKEPELWFQTTAADSPTGETWSSSTAGQYKITSLWSVNVKDWQAGSTRTVRKHDVPAEVQTYWKSQECQTAFSRSPGQEGFTPWSCWLVDAAGTPVASGPVSARTVRGTVDTGWTNPASGTGSEKVTFSYVKGSDGKPALPLSVSGAGGNGASTLDGMSGLIDSGSAAQSERKMWRFTTVGSQLKLKELPKALPATTSTDGETELWVFPDGQAVAKVEDGDAATGWILTADQEWKKVGPWAADLQDAEIHTTA
ncbi:hypothetical protein ACFYXM_28180 [Streptomyces sp. NPDC002476]|uniref:hypothetical protein n=1 Tax=Streptomyces sp. NPDC002476 TaxID=3364648 RepID=UPI0036C4E468